MPEETLVKVSADGCENVVEIRVKVLVEPDGANEAGIVVEERVQGSQDADFFQTLRVCSSWIRQECGEVSAHRFLLAWLNLPDERVFPDYPAPLALSGHPVFNHLLCSGHD